MGWIALVLLEIGIVALPGDPTLGLRWGDYLVFEAVTAGAIVLARDWAWMVASTLGARGGRPGRRGLAFPAEPPAAPPRSAAGAKVRFAIIGAS